MENEYTTEPRALSSTVNFKVDPIKASDKFCTRGGCSLKDEKQTSRAKQCAQSCSEPVLLSRMKRNDRYSTSHGALQAWLKQIEIKSVVVDVCGGRHDLLTSFLRELGHRVITNDIN